MSGPKGWHNARDVFARYQMSLEDTLEYFSQDIQPRRFKDLIDEEKQGDYTPEELESFYLDNGAVILITGLYLQQNVAKSRARAEARKQQKHE
jgi:hypothetical protein